MHKRLFYLDNLKTFALLLGVLFHTSIVYAPNIGYAIKSDDTNFFFNIVTHLIHVFRMPLFFFLSGFFSYMVLNNKGGRIFTFSRIERMFAPMLIGLVFFSPVQYYLVYNKTHSPISFWNYFFLFFSPEEFDFSHIWFLVYLSIYSFLLLINYKFQVTKNVFYYSRFYIQSRFAKLNAKSDFFFANYSSLFLFGVLFCFAAIFITNLFFNKDDSIFRVQPVSFFYYLAFFTTGVVSYKKKLLQNFTLNEQSSNSNLFYFSIRILLTFTLFIYLNELDPYWMTFQNESKKIILRGVHLLVDTILAWSFIFILLYLFKKYLDNTKHILDYLRNSGMSIYLIHHPISLILANYLYYAKIPITIKFCLHTFLVYTLSFFFYHFVIKKSFILKRVFGTK
ncbi:MAG: acyltransferase family protein [Leptospiraceae bacterium]|nr:acyltransferase family protein [Leptospiraceae bacterium]